MAAKKLNLRKRYELLTRGMGWETSYQKMDDVFPYDTFEGIKITDWDKWEDPFRLTMDAYWKFQAEKEKSSTPSSIALRKTTDRPILPTQAT